MSMMVAASSSVRPCEDVIVLSLALVKGSCFIFMDQEVPASIFLKLRCTHGTNMMWSVNVWPSFSLGTPDVLVLGKA